MSSKLKIISIATGAIIVFALLYVIGTKADFFKFSLAAVISPSLGASATYGVLGSTYTNTSAGTTVNGDVGFTTGPAVAPLGTHTNYGTGAPYSTAGTNQGSALGTLNALACDFTYGSDTDLSLLTQPLAPGVYCVTGAQSIGTGGITLSAGGTYVFRSTGALNTVANSNVTLGGASACNVFWTPGAATTLGANSTFAGTDIDDAGITVGSTVVWTGSALAFGGTVTTDTDTITVPTCTVTPPPPPPPTLYLLRVVKAVINDNAGTAVSSDFNLHVRQSGTDVTGSPASGVSSPGRDYSLLANTYVVSEDSHTGYTATFSGDCDASGNVIVGTATKTCTITNNDIAVTPPVVIATTTATTTVIVATTTVTIIATTTTVVVVATSTPTTTPVLPVTPPKLPNTGFGQDNNNTPWNIIIPIGIFVTLFSLYLAKRKQII